MNENFADVTATGLRATRKAIALARRPALIEELSMFIVTSDRDPAKTYQVTFPAGQVPTSEPIGFRCTCPSGEVRIDYPVPCWHVAAVGLELERRGIARRATGLFYAVPAVA